MNHQKILVTGGCGYIGSHVLVELLLLGADVVVIDNLINSSIISLERVKQITHREITFVKVDLCDKIELHKFFTIHNRFDACFHFAGLKAVGESNKIPLTYYHNNITGTLNLLHELNEIKCYNFIFSSSATVYGDPITVPITENFQLSATNPYGRTKLYIEQILIDLASSCKDFNIIILRYFNPIGNHPSGLIGEDPKGIPNNLCPYILKVANKKIPYLTVFGNDYNTKDGTGVRDYIHVVDLAKGHIAAYNKLFSSLKKEEDEKNVYIYNLGTGHGFSVMEIIEAFNQTCDVKIDYIIGPRRTGDAACVYANVDKAYNELGWKTGLTLEDATRDMWNWASNNPDGYS